MEKSRFKKCLHILDKIESWPLNLDDLNNTFLDLANQDGLQITQDETAKLFKNLYDSGNLVFNDNCFDLSEPFYIFSRAASHSQLEALALFEALIQTPSVREECSACLRDEIQPKLFNEYFKEMLLDTCLFEYKDSHLYFNQSFISDLSWMIEDCRIGYSCSYALKAYYTRHLYERLDVPYRNSELSVLYPDQQRLMSIYPKKGIPKDRDCSKELQTFFKDQLFHEFKHQCCLCRAALPQMLIASHIKPFRDCAYLVEAMDGNNGLLLCRNHDYLFDQGFIGFDENGSLLISDAIQKDADIYLLSASFKLASDILTPTRKLFLNYHLRHYYKKG